MTKEVSDLVSVIIPCYNDATYLKEAIVSVTNCSHKNCEIIVVDDGSTDKETDTIIKQLQQMGIRCVQQKHAGLAAARNAGIKLAKSEYILLLDADNKIKKDYIKKAIAALKKDSSLGIIYADYELFGEQAGIVKVQEFSMPRLLIENYIDACTLIRKRVWKDCNGFDEQMDCWEDWEFWINAASKGWKFYHIGEVMFSYRKRPSALGKKAQNSDVRSRLTSYVIHKHKNLMQKYGFELRQEAERLKEEVLLQQQLLTEKPILLANKSLALDHLQLTVMELQFILNELQFVLDDIYRSKAWKMVLAIRKIKDYIFPKSTVATKKKTTKKQTAPERLRYTPLISVITPVYNTEEQFLRECIESVQAQKYPNWELFLINDNSKDQKIKKILAEYAADDKRIKTYHLKKNKGISQATNEGIKKAKGDFVAFLDHDDILAKDALWEVAKAGNASPSPDIIYTDEDKIDMQGKHFDPVWKPDWNPELLLSYCYPTHLLVMKTEFIQNIGLLRKEYDTAQDYDLLLRATEKTERIVHIPKIVYHWRATEFSAATSTTNKPFSIEKGKKALDETYKRRHKKVTVTRSDFSKRYNVALFKSSPIIENPPDVEIIIPTKDNWALLNSCLQSIKSKTTYSQYKITIVDTGSQNKKALESRTPHKINLLYYPQKKFNFSSTINFAVAKSNAEFIILLNDDTEVITNHWIEEMLSPMIIDDKVGAVGVKLLYKNNTIQHAGVVVGIGGIAGHAFRRMKANAGGYLNYAMSMRNYSAVTAACMLIRRSVFLNNKGFDAKAFPITLNDVDYCLRLREQGYRTVYTPFAMLYHKEGSLRGRIEYALENQRFKAKWKKYLEKGDPMYNPNLSYRTELFLQK